MEVVDCIRTRRSIRKYLDSPVEMDKIGIILDAGRSAPSSGNLQNWKFIFVTEKKSRQALASACLQQHWMETAPVHIVIVAEPQRAQQFYGIRGERLYTIQNCAAVIQNMLLAAHSQGLGACWVGAFDEEMIKRSLGIPDYVRPQAVITVGYTDERVPTPLKFKITDITFLNKWSSKIKDIGIASREWSPSIAKAVKKRKEILDEKGSKVMSHVRKKAFALRDRLKEHFDDSESKEKKVDNEWDY